MRSGGRGWGPAEDSLNEATLGPSLERCSDIDQEETWRRGGGEHREASGTAGQEAAGWQALDCVVLVCQCLDGVLMGQRASWPDLYFWLIIWAALWRMDKRTYEPEMRHKPQFYWADSVWKVTTTEHMAAALGIHKKVDRSEDSQKPRAPWQACSSLGACSCSPARRCEEWGCSFWQRIYCILQSLRSRDANSNWAFQ